jgi:hypothetical protein
MGICYSNQLKNERKQIDIDRLEVIEMHHKYIKLTEESNEIVVIIEEKRKQLDEEIDLVHKLKIKFETLLNELTNIQKEFENNFDPIDLTHAVATNIYIYAHEMTDSETRKEAIKKACIRLSNNTSPTETIRVKLIEAPPLCSVQNLEEVQNT